MTEFPKNTRHIHFIGVGGSGMMGLAHLALDLNFKTTGSDLTETQGTCQLEGRGLTFFGSHHKNNLSSKPDLIVISSAISENNVELLAAKKLDIPVLHRSEFLREVTKNKKIIAISGTHGKSTTTALVYHMLKSLGLNPGYYLGARLCGATRSSGWSDEELFVIEADESDGTFLNFRPFLSVITNIDDDHMDFYLNKDNVNAAYKKFMAQTNGQDGRIIVSWDEKSLRTLAEEFFSSRLGFGSLLGADIRLLNWSSHHSKSSYELLIGSELVKGEVSLLGEHNIKNTMAALGVAHALNLDPKLSAKALETFPGIERRCQFLIRDGKLQRYLIDDYAHNPGKIASTLKGLKGAFPDCKLTAIFQPHRYSRFKTLYEGFLHAFTNADKVLVSEIFSSGETPLGGTSPSIFVQALNEIDCGKALYLPDLRQIKEEISRLWQTPFQVVVFLGAGDINKVAFELKEELGENKEEKEEHT